MPDDSEGLREGWRFLDPNSLQGVGEDVETALRGCCLVGGNLCILGASLGMVLFDFRYLFTIMYAYGCHSLFSQAAWPCGSNQS